MAEVFLAESGGAAGFQKQLVIKRVLPHLKDDPTFRELFLDEARLAARLVHPSIAQTLQLGDADGAFFIAMEHVPGVTVTKLVRALQAAKRPFPLGAALRVASQLCEALDYAHKLTDELGNPLRIVHRDVSPSNVMVTPQGAVKLLDFGIARAASHQHQTRIGHTRGKVRYMAPEQARGETLDGRADVFAVGAVLFHMMTGHTPYAERESTRDELLDVIAGKRLKASAFGVQLLPELDRILDKAMAFKRTDRYATANEMAH